jgi:Flp pilus assembly protein TadD
MPSERPALLVLLAALATPALAAEVAPELLAAQGIARSQAGDLAGAAALLARVPEAARTAAVNHHLGLALVRLGRLREGRLALAAAARLAPDARLLLDLGQAYLAEGNAAWATRTLRRASEFAPDDGAIRFYLGVALARLGEAQAAVGELRTARRLGASGAETDAQLALALYLAGKHAQARDILDGPALRDRATRAGASRLLRASLQAQGTAASLLSAELGVGAVVDTNPLYEHETTAPTALGPTLSGSLVLRPWLTPRQLLWLELAGARSFYLAASEAAEKPVGDASPTELRAGAGYTLRLPKGEDGPALSLALSYRFGLTFLDGPPPLADPNHIFLEQHAGQVALLRSGEGSESQLRYTFSRSAYADLARTSWSHELGFEHSASFLAGRIRLLGWVTVRQESATSADYNQVVPGLGLGGSVLGPLELVFGARVGYEYRNHLDSVGGVRWREQRVDSNLALTGEVARRLPWRLTLRAVYQRLQNVSTVESFDYGRDLVTLGLSWSTP